MIKLIVAMAALSRRGNRLLRAVVSRNQQPAGVAVRAWKSSAPSEQIAKSKRVAKKTGGRANRTTGTYDVLCMNERKKYSLLDTTNSSPALNPGSAVTADDGLPTGAGSHPSLCGNIWLNSPVRLNSIVQRDCLEVLAHIPDEAIHLTVCSPPYDSLRRYAGDWSVDYHALGEQLFRVTRPGGIAVVVIADSTKDFAKSLTTARLTLDWCDNAGWRLFEECIYQRPGNPGAWWSRRFRRDHESILMFFKGKRPKTFNKVPLMIASKHAGKISAGTDRQTDGSTKPIVPKTVNAMKCRGTIWPYATSNSEGNRAKLQHPATFPDELARDLIGCFSEVGDIVLDPFAGSGTTCVEAAKAGRSFVGIEIAARYCEIASKRLLVEAGVSQAVSESPSTIFKGPYIFNGPSAATP